MLIFGQAHQEIRAAIVALEQNIAEGRAMMEEQGERLAHWLEAEAALLGITDPATIPAAMATAPITAPPPAGPGTAVEEAPPAPAEDAPAAA